MSTKARSIIEKAAQWQPFQFYALPYNAKIFKFVKKGNK
jgi:hypothetical protein